MSVSHGKTQQAKGARWVGSVWQLRGAGEDGGKGWCRRGRAGLPSSPLPSCSRKFNREGKPVTRVCKSITIAKGTC